MIKTYKFKLKTDNYQEGKLGKVFRATRAVYNFSLDCIKDDYNSKNECRKLSFYQDLIDKKKKTNEYAWIDGVNTQILRKSVSIAYNKFKEFIEDGKEEPKHILENDKPQEIYLPKSKVGFTYNKISTATFGWMYKDEKDIPNHDQITKIIIKYENDAYCMEVTTDDDASNKKKKGKSDKKYGIAIEFGSCEDYIDLLDNKNEQLCFKAFNRCLKIRNLEDELFSLIPVTTTKNIIEINALQEKINNVKRILINSRIDKIISMQPEFIIINKYMGMNKFSINDENIRSLSEYNMWDYFYSTIINKCKENQIEVRVIYDVEQVVAKCNRCKNSPISFSFCGDDFKCPSCDLIGSRALNTLKNMLNTTKYTVIK